MLYHQIIKFAELLHSRVSVTVSLLFGRYAPDSEKSASTLSMLSFLTFSIIELPAINIKPHYQAPYYTYHSKTHNFVTEISSAYRFLNYNFSRHSTKSRSCQINISTQSATYTYITASYTFSYP